MTRSDKILILALSFLLLSGSHPAAAESRVAIVQGRASLKPYQLAVEGIKQSLSQGGFTDIDLYDLDGDVNKGGETAEQIKQKDDKLVITVGTEAAKAMKDNLGGIPVIMTMVYDPVAEGLSQTHPYGAYLKVSFDRQFLLFRKIAPSVKKLALLYLKDSKTASMEEAKQAASRNGLELMALELSSLDQFAQRLEEASANTDMLVMILDQDLYNSSTAKELLLFSARREYPIAAIAPNYVKAGALLSVSADYRENGLTAGKMGARLLKGETVSPPFAPTEKLKVAWNKRIADVCKIASPPESQVDENY